VLLVEWRFVTVVGPGGIGENDGIPGSRARVWGSSSIRSVSLTWEALRDARLVPQRGSLRNSGSWLSSEDPGPGLLAHLKERKALLILDSCDPVIEAVAALGDGAFFEECPQVAISHLLSGNPCGRDVSMSTPCRRSKLQRTRPPLRLRKRSRSAPSNCSWRRGTGRFARSSSLLDTNATTIAAISRKLDGNPVGPSSWRRGG